MTDIKELVKKVSKKEPRKRNDHVLLIDSMNTFIRSFSIIKAMNPQGEHIGGLIGFLKSLGFMMRTIEPTRIICVFDGKGSSINRRNANPNYKANRDNMKVTNWGMFDSREEERASMSEQIRRLIDYLECLPVSLISMEKVEADDVISFIAQGLASTGKTCTIASSDKDFLQIVQPGVQVYAPIKKLMITHENVKDHITVSPVNYLLTKALTGDKSDNLQGVKGVGTKTLIKEYPELLGNEKVDPKVILERAEEKIDEKKIFSRIIHDWDIVEQNINIMNLQQTRLDLNERNHIIEKLKEFPPPLSTGLFTYLMDKDKIETITKNTQGWLELFRPLTIN